MPDGCHRDDCPVDTCWDAGESVLGSLYEVHERSRNYRNQNHTDHKGRDLVETSPQSVDYRHRPSREALQRQNAEDSKHPQHTQYRECVPARDYERKPSGHDRDKIHQAEESECVAGRPRMAEEPQQVLHTEGHCESNLRRPQLIEPHRPDVGHRFQHDDTHAPRNGEKQKHVKPLCSAPAAKEEIEQSFPNGLQFNSSTTSVMAPTGDVRERL